MPRPPRDVVRLQVRLATETHAAVARFAAPAGLTLNAAIEVLVREALAAREAGAAGAAGGTPTRPRGAPRTGRRGR